MTTERFRFVVGVTPGFYHKNTCENIPIAHVMDAWNECAEAPPRYVPCIMHAAVAVYHKDWGCPDAGEDVVIVEGDRNPEFFADYVEWSNIVHAQCERVRKHLKQTTATLTFTDAHFRYLKDSPQDSTDQRKQ